MIEYGPDCLSSGLSPRVRGNRLQGCREGPDHGSIPARAGEPALRTEIGFQAGVYPRACGGTFMALTMIIGCTGLSPRVRGNLIPQQSNVVWDGSIPARAGNRQIAGGSTTQRGSIPARAGEPWSRNSAARGCRVYPRACGGTTPSNAAVTSSRGLSPRVRGNPHPIDRNGNQIGSIPARAGEPGPRRSIRPAPWVYPRACGGTAQGFHDAVAGMGLSPRVRGNLVRVPAWLSSVGSIPARAGEPAVRATDVIADGVYPRACGGTGFHHARKVCTWGLSPRVRGNPLGVHAVERELGSIPARAGEPRRGIPTASMFGVYPRACGGTSCNQVLEFP